ncbi:MAG TPA: hypothetical protein VGM30_24955 [Puia sp.]|jgi:hypothetical protein
MTANYALCRPIDPYSPQDPEFKKLYIEERYTLTLKYVSLPTDIPIIYDWLTPRLDDTLWRNEGPRQELLLSYKENLESDNCQSFMIYIKTGKKPVPICQVDIDQLYGRTLLEGWTAQPGDYSFRIIISPRLPRFRRAFYHFLQLLFEYAFQFPEVKQVVTQLYDGYQQASDILITAGFERIGRIQVLEYRVNIFSCTLESLANRGIQMYYGDH